MGFLAPSGDYAALMEFCGIKAPTEALMSAVDAAESRAGHEKCRIGHPEHEDIRDGLDGRRTRIPRQDGRRRAK